MTRRGLDQRHVLDLALADLDPLVALAPYRALLAYDFAGTLSSVSAKFMSLRG